MEEIKRAFLQWCPKEVHNRIRWAWDGPGLRLRDCCACGVPGNAADPCYGSVIFVLWAHLDRDIANFPGTQGGLNDFLLNDNSDCMRDPVFQTIIRS